MHKLTEEQAIYLNWVIDEMYHGDIVLDLGEKHPYISYNAIQRIIVNGGYTENQRVWLNKIKDRLNIIKYKYEAR